MPNMNNFLVNKRTFSEINEYISAIIELLDLIDAHWDDERLLVNNNNDENRLCTFKSEGMSGSYSYFLRKYDSHFAAVNYGNTISNGKSWSLVYPMGASQIYGERHIASPMNFDLTLEKGVKERSHIPRTDMKDVPYGDFNEAEAENFFDQMQYAYTMEEIQLQMLFSRVERSDKSRDIRSFSFNESYNFDLFEILKEFKSIINV